MKMWMIQWIELWGYQGVFLLILIENIFPPIPSEVILTFSGYLCRYTGMNKWLVILAATAGSVLGAILLYGVGYLWDDRRILAFCESKAGRLLHLSYPDIRKSFGWFEEKGSASVLFCRCIPILRSVISVPAGMARMKWGIFLPFTIIGSALWNIMLVNLGVLAGDAWETVSNRIGVYGKGVKIGLLCLLGVVVLRRYSKKREKKWNNSQGKREES